MDPAYVLAFRISLCISFVVIAVMYGCSTGKFWKIKNYEEGNVNDPWFLQADISTIDTVLCSFSLR